MFVVTSCFLMGGAVSVIGFYLRSKMFRHIAAAAVSTALSSFLTMSNCLSGINNKPSDWQFWVRWVAILLMTYAVVIIIKIRWTETNGNHKETP